MRLKVAVNPQRRTVRSNLAQQPVLNEQPDILVNRRQRNRRNTAADVGVDLLRRIVSGGSYDGLVNNVPLVGRRKAELPGKIAELDVAYAHGNYMRMIII